MASLAGAGISGLQQQKMEHTMQDQKCKDVVCYPQQPDGNCITAGPNSEDLLAVMYSVGKCQ